MSARMLHLAMWYAGHTPNDAGKAALSRGGAWAGYDFAHTWLAHILSATGSAEPS